MNGEMIIISIIVWFINGLISYNLLKSMIDGNHREHEYDGWEDIKIPMIPLIISGLFGFCIVIICLIYTNGFWNMFRYGVMNNK